MSIYPMTEGELEALASRDDLDETTRRLLATVAALAGERSSAYRIKSPEHRIALHDCIDAADDVLRYIKVSVDAGIAGKRVREREWLEKATDAVLTYGRRRGVLTRYSGNG